jgi:uncharacterized GH25 family protein
MKKSFAFVLAALGLVTAAAGHVFWLQPSEFHAKAGELVKLRFRVGDQFPGDVVPRDDARIVKFVWSGPEGERDVVGRDADEVAGIARFKEAGAYVFGYQCSPTAIMLESGKFDSYLELEGLDKIKKLRESAQDKPVNEVYSRCAKAIVAVGDSGTGAFDHVFGLRIELVPETAPDRVLDSGSMTVRLLKDGKPLAGALVKAHQGVEWGKPVSARTDEQGRATLAIDKPGVWVLNAVEMMAAPAESKADWESLWASLSFELAKK